MCARVRARGDPSDRRRWIIRSIAAPPYDRLGGSPTRDCEGGSLDELRASVIGPRGLVAEMIEAAIAAEPGVTMVPFDPGTAIERSSGDRRRPHVVVVIESSAVGLAESWRELMAAGPGITILAVDAARGTGIEYEMRPHAVLLGEVSPDDIVTVIRRIAKSRSRRRRD